MIERRVELWAIPSEQGVKAITSNGVLRESGDLVMGGIVAAEAARRHPELPGILGACVMNSNGRLGIPVERKDFRGNLYPMGNVPFYVAKYNMISFPTKSIYWENSEIGLIALSAYRLTERMQQFGLQRVFLPRPGCTNGGLDWATQVRPLLEPILPDSVTVVYT